MKLGLDSSFKARETESKEILSPHSRLARHFFFFDLEFILEMGVSQCSFDRPARYVDHSALEITDIHCLCLRNAGITGLAIKIAPQIRDITQLSLLYAVLSASED